MTRFTRMFLTVVTAGALLALPTAGIADPGTNNGKHKGQAKSNNGKGKTKRCGKAPRVGYSVSGTLVSFTADNPATPEHEGTVTITVTGANAHARKSGDIADQNPNAEGVQVAGATYTVPASDRFTLALDGFEGADTPSPGDAVHITGKVPVTKKKCAPSGTSTADRYGAVDVRKVSISDRDADV